MIKVIVLVIVLFLIIVYVYTFIKIRKKRKAQNKPLSSVEKFHQKFLEEEKKDTDDMNLPRDFVDKDEFISVIQKEIHSDKNDDKKGKMVFKF